MLLSGLAIGYQARKWESQDANDLITAGFTILDPDGYEVSRFDGFDCGYWTKEPK